MRAEARGRRGGTSGRGAQEGRERGGQRVLCYARMADVHLATLHARLRVHTALLTDVCVRNGLTPRSMRSLIGRC